MKADGPNASRHRRRRRWAIRLVGAAVLLGGAASAGLAVAWVTNPFPESRLERWDRTRTVTASDGTPLLQLVGRDEQWRTPLPLAAHSPLLAAATVAVEDRRFREHHGVDPWAVVRAAWQNLSSGRVVSGASTLSMQVCRMMDDRPRTLESKAIEAFRALQLERLRSKDQILEHYLNVAPYGGNVRGAAAAARRYFGKPADRLSLAEAALLAGLPQSPERLRPDRHPEAARTRRATVLAAMFDAGFITEDQRAAADAEPVRVLPRGGGGDHAPPAALASHAAWMALVDRPAGGRTTIESPVQRMLEEAVAEHRRTLPPGTDIAVVVLDVDRSSIVGLVGSADPDDPADGQVNGVLARRSPGSALKPFIYAAAMDAGRLAADSPLPDAPIDRGGWRPENFDRRFRGTVSTAEALQASLNIPAILVTEELGLVRCLGVMEAAGLSLPADAASRGGLSIAVGGIDVSLLELTNAFATLARGGERRTPRLLADADGAVAARTTPAIAFSPEVAAAITDILGSHRRRPFAGGEVLEHAGGWFAWKTGTSSARRDAVAVGHNGSHAIGVWVGRFAGGGDVAYTGRTSAEPLLARLFSDPRLAVPAPVAAPPAPLPVARPLAVSLAAAAADSSSAAAEAFPAPAAVAAPESRVRIESPRDGDRFIAWNGPVSVPLLARRVDAATGIATLAAAAGTWLLDGRPIEPGGGGVLSLEPGRYELLFVDDARRVDRVRFTVAGTRPTPHPTPHPTAR